METRSWKWIDKSSWGPGPWIDEPCDKIQWQDVQTGMPCLAVRHPEFGQWCGYVGVTADHPLYGVSYGACALKDTPCPGENGLDPHCSHSPEALLHVHGGLTFAGHCQEGVGEGHGICHVPEAGEEADIFWLGFDCNHFGDYAPGLNAIINRAYDMLKQWRPRQGWGGDSYKTLGYVQAECRRLALQLDDPDFLTTHELEG